MPRRPRRTSNRLRVLRAARRWTQTDVAIRLGLETKFRYWQIENEEVPPTDSERRKLARMFGCSAKEVFPYLTS